MKLERREAEILEFLARGKADYSGIAQALGMKKPNLAKYAGHLSALKLVEVFREGRKKVLKLDDSLANGIARFRGEFPALRLADIAAGNAPAVLSFLKAKRIARLKELGLAPATAKRLLAKLRAAGVVFMQSRGRYELRRQAEPVAEFCREMLVTASFAEAEGELGQLIGAIYSFKSPDGLYAIFTTTSERQTRHYWPAAHSAAQQHGLRLMPAGKYYYSNYKPDIGDIAIQMLAISPDARGILFAAALMAKNGYNPRLLLSKKRVFGVGDYIEALVQFIKTKGKVAPAGFPSYQEVEVMLE